MKVTFCHVLRAAWLLRGFDAFAKYHGKTRRATVRFEVVFGINGSTFYYRNQCPKPSGSRCRSFRRPSLVTSFLTSQSGLMTKRSHGKSNLHFRDILV